MNKEEWNEGQFVGTIVVTKGNKNKSESIEIIDDYDERMRGESQWKEERW